MNVIANSSIKDDTKKIENFVVVELELKSALLSSAPRVPTG